MEKQDNKKRNGSKTPVLDSFATNLTELARKDKLEDVIGRENESRQIAQILSRKKKNNPIIVGEPGTGKSTIVTGLALNIARGNVPNNLKDKEIYTLSLNSLVAGTKYRGQFEERMKNLIDELKNNKDIIIFIDEIHTIIGAGNSSGQLDAANTLKPALSNGEIQLIGATTLEEYKKHIETDGAMARRFQKVLIEPSSIEDTIKMVHGVKKFYEDHHNVSFTDEAIEMAVKLSERYITDRFLPDKAFDIIDEAGAKAQINLKKDVVYIAYEEKLLELKKLKDEIVRNQDFERAASVRDEERRIQKEFTEYKNSKHKLTDRFKIDGDYILNVISDIAKIPISKMGDNEKQNLVVLDQKIKKFVKGQDEAVDKLVEGFQVAKSGLNNPNKPLLSVFAIGKSGVGKTFLAKTLAREVFGSEKNMIRFDMSEFNMEHTISNLIGSPPGYVNSDKGGMLTEKIKNNPYSVVLFDEIEKAHPKIWNVFLQLLDEGHITDAMGTKVNFKNCIVIMTSNAGSKQLNYNSPGFSSPIGAKTNAVENELKQIFPPEFLNRFDEKIIFNELTKEAVSEIVVNELKIVKDRLFEQNNLELVWDENVVEKLIKEGYSPEYGARNIARTIKELVIKPISKNLLVGKYTDVITLSVIDDVITS